MIFFFFNTYNKNYLEWTQIYQNYLSTNEYKVCEEYIINYNKAGLKNLKINIKKENDIKSERFSLEISVFLI